MTRDDFLAAVHELADQLGAKLWRIVERQTEAAKAAALHVAMEQLQQQIDGEEPIAPIAVPEARRRAPRRCSTCDRLGHDARRCPGPDAPAAEDHVAADQPPAAPEPTAAPDPEPEPIDAPEPDPTPEPDTTDDEDQDDDDEDPCEAPSPPLDEPTVSPASRRPPRAAAGRRDMPPTTHRVLRAVDPCNNVPPPGWTAEDDRREEHADISILSVLRRAK